MAKPKVFSGFNSKTAEKLLLDAGAFFKNFEVGVDSFDSAVTEGKLIGATSGGGTFSAIPETRKIEIDGVKGAAKGLEVIDEWVVSLMANVKEVSTESIQLALGAAVVEDGVADYSKITAKNYIELTDYVDNVVWVGKLSGSDIPVIIEVLNAISLGGVTLNMEDKSEGLIATTFTGHYDASELDTPPFAIYYPKEVLNTAVVDEATFSKATPVDSIFTITSSSTVDAECVSVKLNNVTVASADYTIGTGTVTMESAYLGTLVNGAFNFTLIMNKGNNITAPTITVTD